MGWHLKKLTFEDLQTDPWFAHVISVCEQSHGTPLPEIIKLGLLDVANNSGVQPKQVVQWVGHYLSIGERMIAGNANSSDFCISWIRLHEIFEGLHDYFKRFADLNCYPDLFEKNKAVKALFSSEELIFLEYERHCAAHIFQEGYRVKAIYNKGKLTEDGLFRRGTEKLEISRIIEEQLKKWNINEDEIAKDFFKRVEGPLKDLLGVFRSEFKV